MKESTNKEKVLKRLRKALLHKTPNPYPQMDYETNVFVQSSDPLEILFAERLTAAGGKFIFCENELEFGESLIGLAQQKGWNQFFCKEYRIKYFLDNYQFPYRFADADFAGVEVGLTLCESLVARTGSVMVSSKQLSGRRLPFYAPIHAVLAYTSQLVPDVKEAINMVKNKYEDTMPSMLSMISGPSRTADVEKTVIFGAHGPKELYVFLVDDSSTSL